MRLIDSFITQLKAQGPSRTSNESKEEEEEAPFTRQADAGWRAGTGSKRARMMVESAQPRSVLTRAALDAMTAEQALVGGPSAVSHPLIYLSIFSLPPSVGAMTVEQALVGGASAVRLPILLLFFMTLKPRVE